MLGVLVISGVFEHGAAPRSQRVAVRNNTPQTAVCELWTGRELRLRVTALVILALACLQTSKASAAATLPEVIDRVRPSVVAIGLVYPPRQPNRKSDPIVYLGTGFAVGNGRQVITNAHVIPRVIDSDGQQKLAVFSGRGSAARVHLASVTRTSEEHDLALLRIGAPGLPALPLDTAAVVREGQEVAFTGFPIGNVLGLYPATHRGIVSAITPMARSVENARDLNAAQISRLRNPYDVYQLDAVAYPGNSGSPLFDPASGKVIGVINAVLVKESREAALQRPSGISYAIPVRFVQQLMNGP
ncbi:MAG: serine protease [Gammaproteobacteria bacterium]|nr:serine protease [Gammaproteobacteria bacterium]